MPLYTRHSSYLPDKIKLTQLRTFPAIRFALISFFTFICIASSWAQPQITLPLSKPGICNYITPVMASNATVAAVSDVHGLLAIGHGVAFSEAHVSLFKLDAKGIPAPIATQILLPKPMELTKHKNYVLGLAFHPKLPLLYVWQDINVPYTNPVPPVPLGTLQFDHLCILNLAKDPPQLITSICRGVEFIHNQGGGGLAIDALGSHLYVPNLREITNAGSWRFGRYPLDAEGLPVVVESKEPLGIRIKKLEDLNAANKVSPPQLTPTAYIDLFRQNFYGSAHMIVPVGKDAVISSGNMGLMAWRPDDKIMPLQGVPMKQAGQVLFAVHPSHPAIFVTSCNGTSESFSRAEQVEGFLTLLPKQYILPMGKLTGPPIILPKQKKIVLGGAYHLLVMDLDEKAYPTGDPTHVYVNTPAAKALVYSEKFDRAYVGTEISK